MNGWHTRANFLARSLIINQMIGSLRRSRILFNKFTRGKRDALSRDYSFIYPLDFIELIDRILLLLLLGGEGGGERCAWNFERMTEGKKRWNETARKEGGRGISRSFVAFPESWTDERRERSGKMEESRDYVIFSSDRL